MCVCVCARACVSCLHLVSQHPSDRTTNRNQSRRNFEVFTNSLVGNNVGYFLTLTSTVTNSVLRSLPETESLDADKLLPTT